MHDRVLITGAASGLGRELALRWAKAGAKICIADINETRAQEVLNQISTQGGDVFFQSCDITSMAQIEELKAQLMQRWQGVDLVINNAGIASADSLEDEDIEQWQQIIEINLLGAVRVSKVFASLFKQQGNGYFLNIASQAGITPIPKMGSYNASKAALVSFSETMRLELVDDNIGVSVMCPGFFKTNLKDSLRTKSEALVKFLDKVMDRATVTSEDVAETAFQGVNNKDFLILSHAEGRKALRIKRWFPNLYLKMMLKQTKRIRGQK